MTLCPENSTIVRASSDPSVRLRTVPAGEAGRIVDAVFAGLSAQSRYLRFHSPVSRLSDPLRRRLTDLDGQHRAAVVAEAADGPARTPIGLVRLADLGGGSADMAIAVVDAWQRRGVGGRLLRAAVELAGELGFTELHGLVLPENEAMRRLARRTFPQVRTRFDGPVLTLAVPIGPAAYTVTHEDLLADLLYRG